MKHHVFTILASLALGFGLVPDSHAIEILRWQRLPLAVPLVVGQEHYDTALAVKQILQREPDFDSRFSALPNVFLTPHVGSATNETRDAMGFRALDNLAAVLSGRAPIDPLWR